MQVFALFPSSNILDSAITYLEKAEIDSHDIFVVPMMDIEESHLSNDKRYPKGRDAVDKGFAFATGISVITAGIGFRLSWGPIIWGILGAIGGFLIGLLISLLQVKSKGQSFKKSSSALPIIIIVNCEETNIAKIEALLYEKGALGVNTPFKKGSRKAID